MRILLVEDSDDLRRIFARSLRGRGVEVREACDGLEALILLEGGCPDLILTDMMMPNLDGLGLIRRLRMMPGMGVVPVVMISAMQSAAMDGEARLAGATEILAKPISCDELFNRIISYL